MNAKIVFFLMIGLVVVVGGLGGASVVYGNGLFQKQAKQLTELKLENRVLEEQQAASKTAKQDIAKYTGLEAIAKAIVPQDKDQAKTVRELSQIAEASGIKLKAISFTASNLGAVVAKPTTDESNKNSAAPTTPAVPPLSQVKPTDGVPGVYTLEVSISPIDSTPIPYSRFIQFLEKLENNRRTAHVNKLTITPTPDNSGLTFTITLNAYVKP